MQSRKADFPLLRHYPELHYLDSAASAQKPDVVLDAMRNFYETSYANPHRGAYTLSGRATEAYHHARATVARFFGVQDEACCIFTRGTTESLNLIATAWGRAHVQVGDEIIVTRLEHHANFVPWQQLAMEQGAHLRIAQLTADGRIDLGSLASLITARTRVVALAHASNVLGSITPLQEVAALAHRVGAIVVVDGAQGAPHLPVNFDTLDVDFYAFSGHKMAGPSGIGGLLGRRQLLEAMPPYQSGGDMIEFVHDDHTTWNVLPHKFEAGTPNVGDAVGLAAAVEYLQGIGMPQIRAHEQALTRLAYDRLSAIEGVRIFGPPPEDRTGVVSFAIDGLHPHDLATILDEHHVAIRAGHHCAQPLLRALGVPALARASFFVYNDASDVDALIDGIETARDVFGLTIHA